MRTSFKWLINTTILLTLLVSVSTYHRYVAISKRPSTLLTIGDNNIYLLPSQEQWLSTVSQATNYLKKNIPEGEKILAAPYIPLYYFLGERNSAVRELNIQPKYFKTIIDKISDVNYIIVSNRYNHLADSFSLEQHGFENVATFGPWDMPAKWISHHAVKIYKRRE